MLCRTFEGFCVVVGLLIGVSSVSATLFEWFDRETQVREADLIVRGEVESVRSFWASNGSVIFTEARVRIDESWKGAVSGERIRVRTLGGTVGDTRLAVDGAPEFASGERVLLFLEEREGAYEPWGLVHGKYRVQNGDAGLYVLGPLPPAQGVPGKLEDVSLDLDDLRRTVESILDEGSG